MTCPVRVTRPEVGTTEGVIVSMLTRSGERVLFADSVAAAAGPVGVSSAVPVAASTAASRQAAARRRAGRVTRARLTAATAATATTGPLA